MSEFVKGGDEMRRRLEAIAKDKARRVRAAAYQGALRISKVSQQRTPVETGVLRGSHVVSQPVGDGADVTVTISVGGPAAPYAVVVHEDLEANHPNGGQARFLASAIEEGIAGFRAGLVAAMAAE